jgi:hypothetical protein
MSNSCGDMSHLFVCEIASDDKLGGGGMNDIKAQAYESDYVI